MPTPKKSLRSSVTISHFTTAHAPACVLHRGPYGRCMAETKILQSETATAEANTASNFQHIFGMISDKSLQPKRANACRQSYTLHECKHATRCSDSFICPQPIRLPPTNSKRRNNKTGVSACINTTLRGSSSRHHKIVKTSTINLATNQGCCVVRHTQRALPRTCCRTHSTISRNCPRSSIKHKTRGGGTKTLTFLPCGHSLGCGNCNHAGESTSRVSLRENAEHEYLRRESASTCAGCYNLRGKLRCWC